MIKSQLVCKIYHKQIRRLYLCVQKQQVQK